MIKVKLKHLQSMLEDVECFKSPKVELEQYATSPHIAACMLHTIESRFGDVTDKLVLDLGCGCGMLSIGASILGVGHCIAVDLDPGALETCRENLSTLEIDNVDLLQMDVRRMMLYNDDILRADTVIMNPPFGTKNNQGIDLEFVRCGLNLTSSSVYSLHKTARRTVVQRKAKEWDIDLEILAELRFDLPATYQHHRQQSKDIEVDLVRFTHKK